MLDKEMLQILDSVHASHVTWATSYTESVSTVTMVGRKHAHILGVELLGVSVTTGACVQQSHVSNENGSIVKVTFLDS
jgi:hypothetical protein